MWRCLRVFKVDLSLINHVRMIRCSYKNSQLNFQSEQRERTILGKHGNSRFKRNRKNKTHPQHTYYTHNSTLLWWVHVQPGLKSNHSGNSWWGYSPYKQAFFIMFSQQSKISSVVTRSSETSLWAALNWAITVHWSRETFPMVRHEYITTQHKGMNRTGGWRKWGR